MQSHFAVGSNVKAVRARHHIEQLGSEIQGYLASNPLRISTEEEPDSGDLVYSAKVEHEIPSHWSAIIGDAVHNLRSALDLLAWQMVMANGGTPDENTAFPISRDLSTYGATGRRRLRGASSRAFRLVDLLMPYSGGNELLWSLHRLDIVDKHRLLIPVGAAHSRIDIELEINLPWENGPILAPSFGLRPSDRLFPLEDGEELFRIKAQARRTDDHSRYRFTFEIAFGDGQVVDGEPVLRTLMTYLHYVERTLQIASRQVMRQ